MRNTVLCCCIILAVGNFDVEIQKQTYRDSVWNAIDNSSGGGGTVTVVHEPCACQSPRSSWPNPSGGVYQIRFYGPVSLFPYIDNNAQTNERPLPLGTIDQMICQITCSNEKRPIENDLVLPPLVRILYLTQNSTLSNEILTKIETIQTEGKLPFWLQPNEKIRVYWSENHMIIWMSSEYLIQQKRGGSISTQLEQRLLQYLDTKLTYGFYEFGSTNYYRFTLAGLLNLVDFASNSTISSKAEMAANRLMEELLLFVNQHGSCFPTAGRNYYKNYDNIKFLPIVWFLTGKGPPLTSTEWREDYVGSFIATSRMNFNNVAATWKPELDTTKKFGTNSVGELKLVHNKLEFVDQIMFLWSAGLYFYPEMAADTKRIIDNYNLHEHSEWKAWGFLLDLPKPLITFISKKLKGLYGGFDISGATMNVYKNNGVVLSSLEDFHFGMQAGQAWPWIATAGDIAVWTQSGVTGKNFQQSQPFQRSNSHLPRVLQKSNVAIIAYRPSKDLIVADKISFLSGISVDTQVSLRFPVKLFDEVQEIGSWLIGRKTENYVAVWRDLNFRQNPCNIADTECEPYYYSDPSSLFRSQVWAVVVGNNVTHGSFASFQQTVQAGSVTLKLQKASLSVDGKNIVSTLL